MKLNPLAKEKMEELLFKIYKWYEEGSKHQEEYRYHFNKEFIYNSSDDELIEWRKYSYEKQ